MFDSSEFPKSLDESLLESWFDKGRESKISYAYLMIIWDSFETAYVPVYVESRDAFTKYQVYPESSNTESLIAIYDLYSESRITL